MKKTLILLIAAIGLSLTGAVCDSDDGGGGGGGGLFSTDVGGGGYESWDMFLMLEGEPCAEGFPGSGAGMLGLMGGDDQFGLMPAGGLFLGPMVPSNGYESEADVPEVYILGYAAIAEGAVFAGDAVNVRFSYRADADGRNGDYFLARAIDGHRYRTISSAYLNFMGLDVPVPVNYSYIATDDGFGLMFMIGLSSAADVFYLDDLQVYVNGNPLFADNFEAGDYQGPPQPLSAQIIRVAMVPDSQTGQVVLQDQVVLEGANTLMATGGRYFLLSGFAAAMDGINGAALNLAYGGLDPYYGQIGGADAFGVGVLQGIYEGWNMPLHDPECVEFGQAMIQRAPAGAVDVSGRWTLRLDAVCEEPGVLVGETIKPVDVSRLLFAFMGNPVPTKGGQLVIPAGFSMGNFAAMSLILASDPANMAQLFGVYDPETGILAGQIMGVLPAPGGGLCTVAADSEGMPLSSFVAFIDDTVFVPPAIP